MAGSDLPLTEAVAADRCFRCDYDLRGVADDRACPECGLLAERSRRPTEELADARPRWLFTISCGLWLVLAAAVLAVVWPFAMGGMLIDSFRYGGSVWFNSRAAEHLSLLGWDAAAVLLLTGIVLFTREETRSNVTAADRRRRRILLVAAWMPVIALALKHVAVTLPRHYWGTGYYSISSLRSTASANAGWLIAASAALPIAAWLLLRWRFGTIEGRRGYIAASAVPLCVILYQLGEVILLQRGTSAGRMAETMAFLLLSVGGAPLPAIAFFHLRSLARRSLNERLMEHAAIVGVGISLTLANIPLLYLLYWFGVRFADGNWEGRSQGPIILTLIGLVSFFLFGGWSVLTLIRGALAFHRAAHTRRQRWRAADRSLA